MKTSIMKTRLTTRRRAIAEDALERHREVRALRKKAKRLRALAQDVGERHAVKRLSRKLDAKAVKLTRATTDEE
jgi:hypothetical protein